MISETALSHLKSLDISRVEVYLLDELRAVTFSPIFPAYSIAYTVVKSADNESADISSLDTFIRSCQIKENIAEYLAETLRGIWGMISKAKDMFDAEMFKAFLLFGNSSDVKSGIYATPNSLSQLAIRLLAIKPTDLVAGYCTGMGSFIRECFFSEPAAQYYGNDISFYAKGVAAMRADILGSNIEITNENIASVDYVATKFDKVFCNHPFGVKISGRENYNAIQFLTKNFPAARKTISLDWLANISIMNTLKDNGKAFAVTTTGTLFRSNERDFRKFFVDNGYINTIIALPAGLFEYTKVSTIAIIFSHGNKEIRYIDARNICTRSRRYKTFTADDIDTIANLCNTDTQQSKLVSISEIAENNYNLDIAKYFMPELTIADGVEFRTIIKNITRGSQLKAAQLDALSSDSPTNCQYLMLSDIQNGQISENLSYITGIEDSLRKYCIKNHSLIISKSGSPIKTAIASVADDVSILATGNLYVVELDEEKINPYFLKAFLDSDLGEKSLKAISAGSVIPNIPIESIRKMTIPLPDMDTQNRTANLYLAALDELKELHRKLAATENRMKEIYNKGNEGLLPVIRRRKP